MKPVVGGAGLNVRSKVFAIGMLIMSLPTISLIHFASADEASGWEWPTYSTPSTLAFHLGWCRLRRANAGVGT